MAIWFANGSKRGPSLVGHRGFATETHRERESAKQPEFLPTISLDFALWSCPTERERERIWYAFVRRLFLTPFSLSRPCSQLHWNALSQHLRTLTKIDFIQIQSGARANGERGDEEDGRGEGSGGMNRSENVSEVRLKLKRLYEEVSVMENEKKMKITRRRKNLPFNCVIFNGVRVMEIIGTQTTWWNRFSHVKVVFSGFAMSFFSSLRAHEHTPCIQRHMHDAAHICIIWDYIVVWESASIPPSVLLPAVHHRSV